MSELDRHRNIHFNLLAAVKECQALVTESASRSNLAFSTNLTKLWISHKTTLEYYERQAQDRANPNDDDIDLYGA